MKKALNFECFSLYKAKN